MPRAENAERDGHLRSAILDEMRFFNPIMFEHALFIRNGLDPSEEAFSDKANGFAREFRPLVTASETISDLAPGSVIFGLMARSIDETRRLLQFKREVARLLEENRLLAMIPADLVNHMIYEGLFYLAVLYNVTGGPEITREELGIPDGAQRAFVVPRRLIREFPQARFELAVVENLFWLKDQFEHTDVLVLYYRPRVQHELVERTLTSGRLFREIYDEAIRVSRSGSGIEEVMRRAASAVADWRSFLARLYEDLVGGRVPTGQISIWPRIVDHMRREADYYLDVLTLLSTTAQKQEPPLQGPPGPPI